MGRRLVEKSTARELTYRVHQLGRIKLETGQMIREHLFQEPSSFTRVRASRRREELLQTNQRLVVVVLPATRRRREEKAPRAVVHATPSTPSSTTRVSVFGIRYIIIIIIIIIMAVVVVVTVVVVVVVASGGGRYCCVRRRFGLRIVMDDHIRVVYSSLSAPCDALQE
jgi:hypothetical protein